MTGFSPSAALARSVVRLGQTLVDGRLEAPHVFYRHVLGFAEGSLQIFVECGEYLTVENLEEFLLEKITKIVKHLT